MTSFQRIIKYCATALAIFLIVTIIGGGVTAILTVTGIKSIKNEIEENKEQFSQLEEYIVADKSPESLYIEVGAANMAIEKGDKFTVRYAGTNFSFSEEEDKLKIESNGGSLFSLGFTGQLVITVPEKISFKKVSVSAGAGDIYIESLVCDSLELDLGAGRMDVDYIRVNKDAEFDGGAGEMIIADGSISNLELSSGVGKTDATVHLKGKNTLEAGIGDTKITLKGKKENYTISAETGIGDFRVDGKRVADGDIIGDGKDIVEIEGGIGAVRVRFEE